MAPKRGRRPSARSKAEARSDNPSFYMLMVDHIARHTHPFLLTSPATRRRPRKIPRSGWRGVHAALTRRTRVFLRHRHRDVSLWARFERAELHMYNLAGRDLSGFSLKYSDLVRATLEGCVLDGALLYQANLEGADLEGASLVRTDLREANLSAAVLRRSDLRTALLQGAVLRFADLRGAQLSAADVSGADLRDARFDDGFDRSQLVSDDHTQWPVAS